MKSNAPEISDLRQQLDILGAELTSAQINSTLILTCCRNITFAAGNKDPLPSDVFQPGINETLMRCALSGLCMALLQTLAAHTAKAKP